MPPLAAAFTATYFLRFPGAVGTDMSLLEELEKEAGRRREQEAQRQADAESRETAWRERTQPALRELEAYLRRLTEQLGYLQKRARVTYQLPGYGEIVAHVEPAYTLNAEAPSKTSYEIALGYAATVAGEECPLIEGEATPRLRGAISALQQMRLNGMTDVRKNANGEIISARVRAKGRIPLGLTVQGDQESGMVRMTFSNLEGFGQSSRSFKAEQLDTRLFDALGRFIAREETSFAQEAVAEDVRRQLQSRIQREQVKREWETRLARQLASDEAKVLESLDPALRPGGLVGRLRLLSRRLIGR